MPETIQPPSRDPGSSSQERLPFTGPGLGMERDATVISAPRVAEGGQPSDSSTMFVGAAPVVPSRISLALFPGQQRAENPADIEGTTLGHFNIRKRIGAGGMGTVFLADDEKLQRQVALKVLSPQQTADPASVHRFQNEARSAARLDHDHIARVFFYGDDQGLHYIAYEYVQGVNLRDLIRSQGRIEAADVVAYAVQMASALCHTSSAGVVHRDIKPSNIIITQQGKAKLVDLGLARKESLEESAQLTVAGTTLGTFDYISPEQAKDPRNVDVRSDIYSLGCTLYHAVTGEPPFPEGTVLQRLLDHHEKEPPDPAVKNRRVSPALSAVIRKMMAVDPKRRYPSAEALLSDLLVVAATMGLRTHVTGESYYDQLARPKQSWWSQNANWILAATTLLLVAGAWQVYSEWTADKAAQTEQSLLVGASSPDTSAFAPPTTASESQSARDLAADLPLAANTPPVTAAQPAETTQPAVPDAATIAAINNSLNSQPTSSGTQPGSLLFPPFSDPALQDVLRPLTMRQPPPTTTGSAGASSPADFPTINPGEITGVGARSPEVSMNSNAVASATNGSSANPSTPVNPTASPDSAGVASAATVNLPYLILGTGQSYATLEAACAEVRDQGVIELHYDGRRAVSERPMRIVNKRITVQAARGRKPLITFAPKALSGDPLQSRMITVSGGALVMANVALEMQIRPGSTADLWAMFRIERADRLRLQNVHATIVNPSQLAASLVESAAPSTISFTKMGAMKDALPVIPTEVLIEQSVIRGEANGFWLRDAVPFNLEFRQSVFVFGEWLVQQELAPDVMNSALRLSIDLTNTTSVLGQGLLRTIDDDDISGRQLPIQIVARNNIISTGPGAALIEQQFMQSMVDNRKSLTWSEEQNHFDAIDTFWLVRYQSPPEEQRWGFDAWKNFWERSDLSDSFNTSLGWSQRVRSRPYSQFQLQDLATASTTEDSVSSGLTTSVPGAVLEQLPTEPPAMP